jgi:hypothetical protein
VQIADDDPESPFLGLIKWPKDSEYVDGARVVVPAAIEESIAYLQDRNVKSFKESDDILLDFFFAIWNRAKVVYGEHFSLILEKIKVVLLTSFVSKMLIGKSDWGELDLADTDAVNTECEKILRHIPSNFWRCEWNGSGYDTKAGRDLLDRSIEKVYRNSRSGEDWYKDVDIINPASVASLR